VSATRRRSLLAAAVVIAFLATALVALALGADALSLALGAAAVAAAFVVLVVLARQPARRGARRSRRRGAAQARQGRRAGQGSTRAAPGERNGDRRRGATGAGRKARSQGRRTIEAIETAETRLFSQLEALDWLRAELQLAHPLPPTRGFAAAPDALRHLVHIIDQASPSQVLELGSGVSTIVIARRLQQAGHGRLVALEHLPEHAARTRHELALQGLADVATVVDAPLAEVRLGTGTWSWYELGDGVPAAIDALFVDGPPGGTGSLARYPALPLLRDRLAPGALLFVDDGDRPDEREMVRRWQTEVDGLLATYLPLAKGAWLLAMPGA
jgi:predicted O-methyltransferase YrrM